MKFTLTEGIGGCTIIKCKFDVKPEKAFKLLAHLPKNRQNTLFITDSECFNTAEFRAALEQANISRLISIGGNEAAPRTESIAQYQYYQSVQTFYDSFREEDFRTENILFFESEELNRLPYLLDQKSRQTTLVVDLDAFAHNIRYFQSKLRTGVKLMALVKAASYGSGAYEVACLMQLLGVDYLGVAASDEGVALRQSGITMPIVVLTPEADELERMVRYKLEPEIYNLRSLNAFINTAQRMGVEEYPIHVKIDTGMHRQGFDPRDMLKLTETLRNNSCVKVASVFTHLAASDEEQHDSFTRQQLSTFDTLSRQLQDGIGYTFMRHALNSAGIERFPEGQFDMVRLGIGMYGGSQASIGHTKTISSFHSTITQIKDIAPGETVGYGRKGEVKKPTRIAVIPAGYADGLNRKLGNGRCHFSVNGQAAPTIGNVCMDLTMLDITGLNVREGDSVTIFGEEPSIFELADRLGTISYEILTNVATRVKRVYCLSEKIVSGK